MPSRFLTRHKKRRRLGRGNIIFIASLLSFQGGITVPGYAGSKGAITQFTTALANEWYVNGATMVVDGGWLGR